MNLEDSMVMYGIHNVETLEKIINTVHQIHNFTSPNGKLFAGWQGTALLNHYILICKAYNIIP